VCGRFRVVSEEHNQMSGALEDGAADLVATVERLRSDLESLEEIQALLGSGAGLGEILSRAAERLGLALQATGVGVWCSSGEKPGARWGMALPTEAVEAAGAPTPTTSVGALADVPAETEVAWAVAPGRRNGRVLCVVALAWDPPRPLDQPHRDLLVTLTGIVAVAVENVDLLERLKEKEESLEALLRNTLTAQEEERRRISRELHDETSQVLSALLMNIDLLESKAPVSEGSGARIAAVKALAEEAVRNLDKMMLELRPALLDELGLIAALRWYVAQVGDLWEVQVEFEGGKTERLPDTVEVAAFRIVQEAVCNAARHSGAPTVRVRIGVDEKGLHLEVSDHGCGFDVAAQSAKARSGEAVGLLGMRERAELVGGTLRIVSSPGRGTKVDADIPLPRPENPEGS
jgi:signal transduction histidine kinase